MQSRHTPWEYDVQSEEVPEKSFLKRTPVLLGQPGSRPKPPSRRWYGNRSRWADMKSVLEQMCRRNFGHTSARDWMKLEFRAPQASSLKVHNCPSRRLPG